MQKTASIVNSGKTAPLTNVALCLGTLKKAMNRPKHLPGIVVFYGPSGYGKSRAAAQATIQYRACCVQIKSMWTRKGTLEMICKGLGLHADKTAGGMLEQIAEELSLSGRPLIIDEADFLVERGQIEIIRDIYESSLAPIMLIGEELLPNKLSQWERFHGRVLDWCPAQPVSFEDVRALYQLYKSSVEIADDLLHLVYERADGSARRVCVNFERISDIARVEGRKEMDLAAWGTHTLFTGEAPKRGR